MTKQSEDFQRIIDGIKSNNSKGDWSGLIKDAKGVSVAVKEVLSPCNIKLTEDDQQRAEIILADDKNYAVRYLRQHPTVGLATVPVRNKDGEIISDMDWVRKRVICAGIPYACMIAFMHQDKLLIGWSKRIAEKTMVETRDLHMLFKTVLDSAIPADSDNYKDAFGVFCRQLMSVLSYQEPKDIEISFSKNGGKTAAIIRGLHDDLAIYENNYVKSSVSGPVPNEVAKNLRWFIDYAERTYGGKAGNVLYPESAAAVPAKAENILPAIV